MKKNYLLSFIFSMAFIVICCTSCTSCNSATDEKHYDVVFDSDGGTVVESQSVGEGEKATKPDDPTKTSTEQYQYEFDGWYLEDELFDFSTEVTSDLLLKAKWKEITKTYFVTFDTDGGSLVESDEVLYGKKATKPEDPTKDGYDFIQWQLDGEEFDFETPITKNIELKAIWANNTATYYVQYYLENLEGVYVLDDDNSEELTGKIGTTASVTPKNIEHFTYNTEKQNVTTGEISKELELKLYYSRDSYTVTYKVTEYDANMQETKAKYTYDTEEVKYLATATKNNALNVEGFKFESWVVENTEDEFDGEEIDSDIVVEGKLISLEVVELTSFDSIATYNNQQVILKLVTDITVNLELEESVLSKSVIDTLAGILDGNGHKITVNVTGSTPNNLETHYNFIKTITSTGVLKNADITYRVTFDKDVDVATLCVKENNGIVKDCILDIAMESAVYVTTSLCVMGGGDGSYQNCIVYAPMTAGIPNCHLNWGETALKFENVLFVTGYGDEVSGTNVVKIATRPAYKTCKFDVTSFNIDGQGSCWTADENGIPHFVCGEVKVASASDITKNIGHNVNFVLTDDIVFNLTDGNAIDTLSTVIDGQGYSITINVNSNTAYNFIKNLYGVVKNAKIVYNFNGTTRLSAGNLLLTSDMSGTIANCEIIFNWGSYPGSDAQSAYLGVIHGTVKNCTIAAADLYGEMTLCWTDGKFENVLLKTTLVLSDGTKTNVVSLTDINGYATCGFDDDSFNIGGQGSYWTMDKNGIPCFASRVVKVASASDITKNAGKNVDFVLIDDIEFDLTDGNAIDTLSTGIDGQGHTITINTTGSFNLVKTISGVLKNAKIVYNYNGGVYLDGVHKILCESVTASGAIQNCDIQFNWCSGFTGGGTVAYLGTVNGLIKNCVISAPAYDGLLLCWTDGKFENVLLKTTLTVPGSPATVINTVALADVSGYATCGFDDDSFNIGGQGSYWTTDENGIPCFVRGVVQVASAGDITKNKNKNVDFVLTNDIEFNLTEGNAIDTLSTVIDGQGHTITINVNSNTVYNFVKDLYGTVKNAKIVYNFNGTAQLPSASLLLTQNMSGTIENCEIIFNWGSYPGSIPQSSYLGVTHGLIKNCVIAASNLYGEMTLCWTDGKFENVLFKSTLVLNDGTKTNVVSLTDIDGYATCGFDDDSLNIDGQGSYWTTDEHGIPTMN